METRSGPVAWLVGGSYCAVGDCAFDFGQGMYRSSGCLSVCLSVSHSQGMMEGGKKPTEV